MAIVLEAITHVWFAGMMIEPGEVFSADDTFAKKLIKGKSAKVHKAVENNQVPGDPHAELRKSFMELSEKELRDLATEKNVEITSKDTTKGKITQKLIEAGVVLDEQANV